MTGTTGQDPIESYLDALFVQLKGNGRDARRLLIETESHLHEAVESGVAEGLSFQDAQQRALQRFGTPNQVANAARDGDVLPQLAAEAVASMWRLSSAGLLSIAASGVVAATMVVAFGKSFVFGANTGDLTSASACAHWLNVQPQVHTCAQAFSAENYDDGLQFRFIFGILGLLVLGAGLLVRRWWVPRKASASLLPDSFTATIGSTVFGATSVYLAGYGIDLIVLGHHGAGQWLSAAVCAGIVAAGYLTSLARTLVTQATAR